MLTREEFAAKLDFLVEHRGAPTDALLRTIQELIGHDQRLREDLATAKSMVESAERMEFAARKTFVEATNALENLQQAEMERSAHLERLIMEFVRVGEDDQGTAVQQIENALRRLTKEVERGGTR